jgi:hypothetical protein
MQRKWVDGQLSEEMVIRVAVVLKHCMATYDLGYGIARVLNFCRVILWVLRLLVIVYEQQKFA